MNKSTEYAICFWPKDEPEEVQLAKEIGVLLKCRWPGSTFLKSRSQTSVPSTSTADNEEMQGVTYVYTQPKFYIGIAKMRQALGNLGYQCELFDLSDGLTVEEVLTFRALKLKYEVPDILESAQEWEGNTEHLRKAAGGPGSIYGKRKRN